MEKYTPISCDLYDHLEIAAMHKRLNKLEIWNKDQELVEVEAMIENLYTRESIEYAELSTGEIIRLDQLHRFNDMIFSESCSF